MKKKLIAMALICAMMAPMAGVYAADVPESVQISFKVGDSTLSINGTNTEVETPYVVGDGVTLVPLRVITESFGAEVKWDGAEKIVTLTYPDVNIVLQIDNINAEVNGVQQKLLSAPELTPNGVTMVPLRFISETFGAQVGYDETAQAITVTKKAAEDNQSGLVGAIDNAYIGDSDYGWSIQNPKDFVMTDRDFSGTYTQFVYDEKNKFYISILPLEEDFDFNKTFSDYKNDYQGATMIAADKDESAKTMHFRIKKDGLLYDERCFVTDKYFFEVMGMVQADNKELSNTLFTLIDSFRLTYNSGEDIHNLSNVENGYRTFQNEELNLSVKIPQDYYQSEKLSTDNRFVFKRFDINDTSSDIHLAVYSKSAVGTARALAEKDKENNQKMMNSMLVSFTDIAERVYGNMNTLEYSYTIEGSQSEDRLTRDVFFEEGDYVYNIAISMDKKISNARDIGDTILKSIDAKAIDTDKVGILMRNDVEEGTYTSKLNFGSITLPSSYEEMGNTGSDYMYLDIKTGILMSISKGTSSKITLEEIRGYMNNTLRDVKADGGKVIKETTKTVSPSGYTYYMSAYEKKSVDGKELNYIYTYMTDASTGILFAIIIPEVYYTDTVISEFETAIDSFKLNA